MIFFFFSCNRVHSLTLTVLCPAHLGSILLASLRSPFLAQLLSGVTVKNSLGSGLSSSHLITCVDSPWLGAPRSAWLPGPHERPAGSTFQGAALWENICLCHYTDLQRQLRVQLSASLFWGPFIDGGWEIFWGWGYFPGSQLHHLGNGPLILFSFAPVIQSCAPGAALGIGFSPFWRPGMDLAPCVCVCVCVCVVGLRDGARGAWGETGPRPRPLVKGNISLLSDGPRFL